MRLDLSWTCSDKKCLLRSSCSLGRTSQGRGPIPVGLTFPSGGIAIYCQERGVHHLPKTSFPEKMHLNTQSLTQQILDRTAQGNPDGLF